MLPAARSLSLLGSTCSSLGPSPPPPPPPPIDYDDRQGDTPIAAATPHTMRNIDGRQWKTPLRGGSASTTILRHCTFYPGIITHMMSYSYLQFQGDGWLMYDRALCTQAASRRTTDWTIADSGLYAWLVACRSCWSTLYQFCFSSTHKSQFALEVWITQAQKTPYCNRD